MKVPPKALRRLVIAPLAAALEVLLILISPALLLVGILTSPLFGGWRPVRMTLIVLAFAARHLLATLACLGLWVASGASWRGNRTMRRGMSVRSTDGRYLFAMQTDGNLVLYGPSGRATWATDRLTGAWRSQEYVVFQPDGNLVTYGGGRPIWASNTAGRPSSQPLK